MTTKALERQVGRVFSLALTAGLNATGVTSPIRRSLAAMSLFALEKLRGLDRDGFDVAIGPRLAVDRDLEVRADHLSKLSTSNCSRSPR